VAEGELRNAERGGEPLCRAHPDGAGDVSAAGAVTAGVCDGGSGGAPGETAGADVGADPLNGYRWRNACEWR
jgi:hypothetical protein